ncbi:MAG: DUF1700 domain-containing protein [Lachnospiraceae bacterium]|nr:DUF1700 domain-containing protein [Lachnospiraceae bacterium]
MNKDEFMRELDRLLQNIPESERNEALSYYEEYFDDAGAENEQQVIEELGYPGKIADNIKESLRGHMGYQNMGNGYQNTGYQHIGTQNVYTGAAAQKKNEDLPTWAIVLIVIGCILASPIILSAAGTILGAVVSLIAGIIGLIIGFGVTGVALLVAAVACLIVGIPILFTNGFAGMLLTGMGLIFGAIGLSFILGTVWLCGWALPTFIKWIVKMCKKLFQKKQDEAAA